MELSVTRLRVGLVFTRLRVGLVWWAHVMGGTLRAPAMGVGRRRRADEQLPPCPCSLFSTPFVPQGRATQCQLLLIAATAFAASEPAMLLGPRQVAPAQRLVLLVLLAERQRGERLGHLKPKIKRMRRIDILRLWPL